MKKIISIILCAVLLAAVFAGCAAKQETEQKNDGKLKVVCTIFPAYDWALNVLGDKAEAADVTLLLDTGADLHSFQPTADDIVKISTCDVFIYVGGESDSWVDDALKNATNQDMKTVNLLETLGNSAKEEEVVEGMQGEEEEDAEGEGEEEPEYDEHVWLSLKNAGVFVDAISTAFGEADATNKDAYTANAAAYKAQLDKLDKEYESAVASAKTKVLLFGDRFPFRYLTDDYGIKYYAAFVGCSAESEASFETITFLAGKADELNLKNIMVIESSDKKIANTIIQNTKSKDQKVLVLDSMQSTTAKDVEGGATYLKAMQSNLAVLKEALA
ncbi:MAG: zinc ABC transporter substrate-binding protein [Eubacterium sp.]|nr:zinc ABC transporter substrate-binding protein [Eubacterium sp.]